MKVHRFESTGEAYNRSQCDDGIKDGDVLVVETEKVVGVMVKAWPTAVTDQLGQFHGLDEEGGMVAATAQTWKTFEDGRYHSSFLLALAEAVRIEALPPQIEEAQARTVRRWAAELDAEESDREPTDVEIYGAGC